MPPKSPQRKDIVDGAADVIWEHVGGSGKTPLAAKRCAHDLIQSYEESQGNRAITELDVLAELRVTGAGHKIGADLAHRALIPVLRDPQRRFGIVTLKVELDGDELTWAVASCDIEATARETVATRNPCSCNPALGMDRYEVVKDGVVVGHVEASWGGDAQDLAEKQFGRGAMAFIETPGKPTPVGGKLWGGRANPGGEHVASFTDKGNRMYEHVLESHRSDPRAKEIAARTVYAKARAGTPGLVKNPGDQYLVLRVDGGDAYAVPYERRMPEAIAAARALAHPRQGAVLEYAVVEASSASAARRAKPPRWSKVARFNPGDPGSCTCDACQTAAEILATE